MRDAGERIAAQVEFFELEEAGVEEDGLYMAEGGRRGDVDVQRVVVEGLCCLYCWRTSEMRVCVCVRERKEAWYPFI